MAAPQPVFRVYVHPNSGPITPVVIDVAAVTSAGDAAPGRADDVMAQALAAQIDARLKTTRAGDNLGAFKAILRHIDPHFSTHITGIVVRVPGTTPGGPDGDSHTTDELRRQVTELTQQVSRDTAEQTALRTALSNATRENTVLRERLRGGGVSDQAVEQWRQRVQALEYALTQAKGKVEQLDGDLTAARREKGSETTRAERAEHQRDAVNATLAQQTKDAEATKGRLNGTINALKNDMAQLNQQVKQLRAQLEAHQDNQTGSSGKPPMRPNRVRLPQHIGADE